MHIEHIEIIKPRISDINYGDHVGHVELIHLLHEVRVRFLHQYSLKETDVYGHVLMMRDLSVTYKSQVFWSNELRIKMRTKLSGAKIIFDYNVFNNTSGKEAALAEAIMVLLNREKGNLVKPDIFIRTIKNDSDKGKN